LISNHCHQTGKCSIHTKVLIGRSRNRYIDPFIATHIHRPIRAGLLYGVNHMELLSLITNLLIPDFPGPEDETIHRREECARLYIAVVSGFTVPDLVDNCFWGDAITGIKKCPPKRKRNEKGVKAILHRYFLLQQHQYLFIPIQVTTTWTIATPRLPKIRNHTLHRIPWLIRTLVLMTPLISTGDLTQFHNLPWTYQPSHFIQSPNSLTQKTNNQGDDLTMVLSILPFANPVLYVFV
jgi:hypothetical protein